MTTVTRPVVIWIDEGEARADELGGKVNSLAELTAAGFQVPPAFGITISAFARFAREAGLPERVAVIQESLDLDDHAMVADASARIAAMIHEAPLPADIDEAIRTAYGGLGDGSAAVAGRSSGANEDLEGASFAGQYDTFLWITGADAVIAHVRRCWASLFNPEVLTYRPAGTDGLASSAEAFPAMCVGVQLMVPARTAGVMFTLDPVSGDRSKIVIESCWGLGEGVVKGEVTPDLHRVDKISFEIRDREVAEKLEEYRFDEATGAVDRFPITDDRVAECSLSEDEVLALAALGKRIERHRGAPQDLEWAIAQDGSLHLLQARPETVWAARAAAKAAERPAEAPTATRRVISAFLDAGKKGGS